MKKIKKGHYYDIFKIRFINDDIKVNESYEAYNTYLLKIKKYESLPLVINLFKISNNFEDKDKVYEHILNIRQNNKYCYDNKILITYSIKSLNKVKKYGV